MPRRIADSSFQFPISQYWLSDVRSAMRLFLFPFRADEGERIEGEIVEAVGRMRASGLWTADEERIATSLKPAIFIDMSAAETGFLKPMTGLYRNYDVIPAASMTSGRPVVGRLVSFVKRSIRKVFRFYINRSLERQTGFNQASVSAHQRAMAEIAVLRREIDEIRRRVDNGRAEPRGEA